MTGGAGHDELLGRVLERLEALEAENSRLASELAGLKAPVTPKPAPVEGAGEGADDQGGVSRRHLLRAIGAGAAAATGLVAGGALGVKPAAAGSDGDLALGSVSNTASSPTGLSVFGGGGTSPVAYGIGVTDNGLNAYPAGDNAAVFGHSHSQNFFYGVFGYADAGDVGVLGVSQQDPGTGAQREGVRGEGDPGVFGWGTNGGAGVFGQSQFGAGAGVEGIGSPGVHGFPISDTGVGVQGTTVGYVGTAASGIGVLAEAVAGAAVPTADSIGLLATNAGLGVGVKATSVSGVPVLAQVTNATNGSPAVSGATNGSGPVFKASQTGTGDGLTSTIANTSNTSSAVYGTTNGTGAALRGVQSGKGSGVYGQITNPSNTAAAVLGAGSASGRGGQFSGGAAQLRLVPASGSHPGSGKAGDLFLDNSGALFLCKGGTTWKLIA